jgi:tetratricopeptide (TPR) repeat protein
MKKIVSLMLMLLIVMTFGCRQKKEEKSQINYAPAAAPADLLMQLDKLQQDAKMAPGNAQAWTRLGDALMDSQRFAEAIDAYDKALALDPKNVNVLVDQGTCYRGAGKFDKAVEQYRKALKINPNFPNGHRNLAVVLSYDLHDNEAGIQEFKRYLEIAPNAPDAEAVKQTIKDLSARK